VVPFYDYEKFAVPYIKSIYITRKDQKALEREIPFHMIPDDQREGYADALAKEWQTWCKYEAVSVLDLEASEHVMANVDPSRILATRVCYRNKNVAFPWMPIKYKARIVYCGDQDTDLLTLRRDAPALARLSLMLICHDLSTGSVHDWHVQCGHHRSLFARRPIPCKPS
jgi:hypothetical protein